MAGRVRAIRRVVTAVPTVEGGGVRLRRAFGAEQAPLFDPFLLLDEIVSDDPAEYVRGFPWHPHRGIETVTYVRAGRIDHCDSLGNSDSIGPGDVQWTTAGSGIIHEEMPAPGEPRRLHGFQLWANLPSAQKMSAPRYRRYEAEQIPEVTTAGGARVRVVGGAIEGTRGPACDLAVEPTYLDVRLPGEASLTAEIRRGLTVFGYVYEGEASFGEGPVAAGSAVLLGDGDEVTIDGAGGDAGLLLVAGRPLGEPIAWRGPIVMNTAEELRDAVEDYHDGTFIKHQV